MTASVNLTSPTQVRTLLETRGLQPNQVLGQNFLIDANIRDIIVDAAEVGREDVVLEIGPGLGVITEPLVQRARRVIAVEKDAGLYRWLQEALGDVPTLQLIHADALDIVPQEAPGWGITRLVSNLPYSVGSRVLMDVFALPVPPLSITVTIQLEVADRLAAGAGHPERGLLSVWAQRWYDVKVVKKISPGCFVPRPKVMSAVVRLTRHAGPPPGAGGFFRDLTRACFGYRRKQIGTILGRVAGDLGLEAATAVAALGELGIEPRLRPETFTVDTWEKLAARLAGERGVESL
jgi:16S rRNA (adenine1518-N6/adenine1519-N6)-dimethyltransferase